MAGVRSIRTLKKYRRPDEKIIWTGNSGQEYQECRKRDTQDGGRDHDAFTPHLITQVGMLRDADYTGNGFKVAVIHTRYIIFYNNVPGIEDVSSTHPRILAVAMATAEEGEYWLQALAAGSKVTSDLIESDTVLEHGNNTITGDFASTFTSWDPTWEAELKPQFATPGGHILLLWPRALESCAVFGGTSMATPLVSGVLALMTGIRGHLDPVELTNIFAATAKSQFFNDGKQASSQLAPVPQQRAGLIQAYGAASMTTILSVPSLAFNDTEHLSSLLFSIENIGDAEVTYTLDHRPVAMAYTFAAGTGRADTFPNELTDDYATLHFSKPVITAEAGREEKVTVSLDLLQHVDNTRLPMYSGYIAQYGMMTRCCTSPTWRQPAACERRLG
ncbi:serin endopeptidase [Verticillium alfalfae VaMs.102]|uniref:Serin endopeptidase n=1 Tax=Verticillium alfalfae (strain VaMs.102 / ATCC MYA-4576 / FGSC 10136) TaxID=526221 RepID=C9SER4_VERA1|nr:serin endopeptidase [Verticillium alfalfae VaMs.102]EEY16657.1 serin endopeptidase [Verticillium alfalfae VaMs.102]